MNKLKEECDCHDDTPIVWKHLENYVLTTQVIESHLPNQDYDWDKNPVEITLKGDCTDEGGNEEE